MADPFAILQASQTSLPDIMNAASTAKQNRLREMMLNRQVEREDQLDQTRQKAAGLYRAGDRKGAKDEAIAGGDFDFADHMSKLDQADLDRLKQRSEVIGQVAQWADTPEKWDQGVDFLVAQGYNDLSAYKGKFSPAARMAALSGAGQVKDYFERTKPINMAPGNQLRDPITGTLIAQAPFAPWREKIGEGETLVGGQEGGSPPTPGFQNFYSGFLAGAEGGYNSKDPMSGAPVNFGIDQRANPDIDVKNLTQPQAAKILHDRYWVPSGADQIADPALQAIHADTAINMGVEAAKNMLQQAGGDPAKYLALREQRYRQIGGPVLDSWLKRNQTLGQYAGVTTGPGSHVIAQGPPKAPKLPDAPSGYRFKPDGSLEPIPGGPATRSTQQNKPIPASTEQKLSDQFDIFSALQRAESGWKNDFGGNTVTGGLENTLQSLYSGFGTPGQREWWADFQTTDNLIRNQMFGSALTATEKAAYEKTTVSERMDPKIIKQRITKRREIIEGALRRRARVLAAQGFSQEAISAMFGDEPSIVGGLPTPNSAPAATKAGGAKPTVTNW